MNELLSQPVRNVIECIESWHDENGNWYRIYSDGWCEQGGVTNASGSSYQWTTVNLHKSYINTTYSIQVSHYHTINNVTNGFGMIKLDSKTVNSFIVSTGGNPVIWETKGYIK